MKKHIKQIDQSEMLAVSKETVNISNGSYNPVKSPFFDGFMMRSISIENSGFRGLIRLMYPC
jgi:hypothetical protein